jgi:hypothetical protein
LGLVLHRAIRSYERTLEAVRNLQRQVRPLAKRLNEIAVVCEGIAADAKSVTALAVRGAEKAGIAAQAAVGAVQLMRGTVHRSMWSRVLALIAISCGVRAACRSLMRKEGRHESWTSESPRDRRVRRSPPEPAFDPRHSELAGVEGLAENF